MGTSPPSRAVWPYTSLEERTSGSIDAGIPKRSSSSVSHCNVLILNSMVRDALETSVTCTFPPVRFHTSQLSTVPNRRYPASAMERAPGVFSRIHRTLVALKYASMINPVFSRMRAVRPCAFRLSQ